MIYHSNYYLLSIVNSQLTNPPVSQTLTFNKLPKGGRAPAGSAVQRHFDYLLNKVKPAVAQTMTFISLFKGGRTPSGSLVQRHRCLIALSSSGSSSL